jgi:hypothetical protein
MAFNFDSNTWAITMHRGDTGSKWVHATRGSGDDWTDDDRCLFTVRNTSGEVVIQRIYRLDDQWGAGNGYFLMEFHNNDTDTLPEGIYNTEWRFDISPQWNGTAPTGRCVNGMTAGVRMIEGSVVRTKIQSTMTLNGVLGDI